MRRAADLYDRKLITDVLCCILYGFWCIAVLYLELSHRIPRAVEQRIDQAAPLPDPAGPYSSIGESFSMPAPYSLVDRSLLILINIYIELYIIYVLKKNQNAPRPSEHPPVMGGKCQNVY